MISFIVATYNRPNHLMCLLYSIKAQTSPDWEIIVMDEGDNEELVKSIKDDRIQYRKFERVEMLPNNRGTVGILPKDAGVQYAEGNYLAFPSEDIYYPPVFIEEMTKYDEDIIACDMLYSYMGYSVLEVKPQMGNIDVCNYIIKPEVYKKHPFTEWATVEQVGIADGMCPEKCVQDGASFMRIPKVLAVHN
jgi:glycosyltransferase involved in cell wall biosynthesis